MVIYVEGGTPGALADEARRGFTKFFEKCLKVRRPRVIACGPRTEALKRFQHGRAQGQDCLLLLDSEEVAARGSPWDHPRMSKECPRPHPYADADLHFMATVMETWLAACPEELEEFYGQGFKSAKLPQAIDLETVTKRDIYAALEKATKETKTKGAYGKGSHSFKLLALVDPMKVRRRCSYWAKRLCEELNNRA